MVPDVISMGGAAFRTSHILGFESCKAFIDDCMKNHTTAFADKMPDVRRALFGQIYDLACPPEPKKKEKKSGNMG